jgi:protoporphyrin/coproporphyrin ferrochelatase
MRLAIPSGRAGETCRSFIPRKAFRLPLANTSEYVRQLEGVRRLVSVALAQKNDALVYQSRSGALGQPWLEPDILDYLHEVKARNPASAVVLAPISFISDHMEVLYDPGVEAWQLCDSLGVPMTRAKAVGVHPKFIGMIRELILERMKTGIQEKGVRSLGPWADTCAGNCCPAPQSPGRPQAK